jgi:regulator of RNase E activity RraA
VIYGNAKEGEKMNDKERIDFLKKTETGFVTDALELLKVGGWTWGVYPANPKMKVAGRAFTVKFDYVQPEQKFIKHMMNLYEHFKPGDVLVVAAHEKGAITGEHVIYGAINAGYEGYVIDGYVRDYGGIAAHGFPTFCCGPAAGHAPKNFKAVAVNIPITIGGAEVHPGDYIIGDIDGVIVIPADKIDEVIDLSAKIAEVENRMVHARKGNKQDFVPAFLALSKEKHSLRRP